MTRQDSDLRATNLHKTCRNVISVNSVTTLRWITRVLVQVNRQTYTLYSPTAPSFLTYVHRSRKVNSSHTKGRSILNSGQWQWRRVRNEELFSATLWQITHFQSNFATTLRAVGIQQHEGTKFRKYFLLFHPLSKILKVFFYLELKATKTTNLTGSNVTGNNQTSNIHNTIKFENCLPSGWAKFHQKLQQNHQLFPFYSCYCG